MIWDRRVCVCVCRYVDDCIHTVAHIAMCPGTVGPASALRVGTRSVRKSAERNFSGATRAQAQHGPRPRVGHGQSSGQPRGCAAREGQLKSEGCARACMYVCMYVCTCACV